MNWRTDDFDYELPEELIASHPLGRREASRMLIVDRDAGTIGHAAFADFTGMLRDGDLVVLNDTRVVPSRFFSDDRKVELVRLDESRERLWKCLVRPGKRMKVGRTLAIGGVTGTVREVLPDGERLIEFDAAIDPELHGELALPHYMKRDAETADHERYQTVYARSDGAIAAPTAGLHFTSEILSTLPHCFLTLHVGIGTFTPVRSNHVAEHKMHVERFHLGEDEAARINSAERVVAVGTTVARVLEHLAAQHEGTVVAGAGETGIFIYPPYEIRRTNALLTNFHLPKSTLFMLVCAMAGKDLMTEAYAAAVAERYRFFSYGDCMLIV